MTDQIKDFVGSLLTTEPGAPFSVQLEVDTDGDVHALFEVLLMIMTEVLKRWYSPPITIGVITPVHLAKLIGYFASFGIQFSLEIDEHPRITSIHNGEYLQKSQLKDMKFKLTHAGKLYTVSFANLPKA